MNLIGAGLARMSGRRLLEGRANYFVGQDPAKWVTGVPRFAAVRYHAIYPGINLTVTGDGGDLEYDFTLAPGADPRAITLGFAPEIQDAAAVSAFMKSEAARWRKVIKDNSITGE